MKLLQHTILVEIGLRRSTAGLGLTGKHIVFRRPGQNTWHTTGVHFGRRPGDAYEAGLRIGMMLHAPIKARHARDAKQQVEAIERAFLIHVENGASHVRKE